MNKGNPDNLRAMMEAAKTMNATIIFEVGPAALKTYAKGKPQLPEYCAKAALEIKTNLQGIGFGSKDAYAVIGGDIFYVGDTKKGIKLLEVRRREVDINENGEKVTLSLFPGEDLQKAKDRAKKKRAMQNASVNQSSEMPSSLSEREQSPL